MFFLLPVGIPCSWFSRLLCFKSNFWSETSFLQGINVAVMEKTEKSMVELEIDVNKKFEYSTITESGTQLVPIYGPGYTGMKNLGNTCYMNR